MTTEPATGTRVRLQHLTYVDDGDGVMVGRPDVGSYAVFPSEGADLLRSLEAGVTLEAGALTWHDQTGETLDTEDFLTTLEDLGFLVGGTASAPSRRRSGGVGCPECSSRVPRSCCTPRWCWPA